MTYLFCIVAPAASFALADGPRAMHCLDADVTQVHSDDLPVTAHDMHMDAGMHDHAAMAHMVAGDDMASSQTKDDADHGMTHKTSSMPCCSMSCPGALPAALPDVVKPLALTTICMSAAPQRIADNAPPRLYRPPIS